MKYLDEFQDPELAKRLLDDIHATATNPWAMMEVCGGQTHSIIRHGLDQLLPDGIELIHGPGCPVCVTPLEIIDKALEIASRPDVIFCSFGDMLRVPGSEQGPVPGQERRRRRARRLLAARRAQHRAGEPRQAGRVLRHRLRDHRAAQRDDRLPGQEARHRELQPAGQPRPRATGDRGDHDLAGLPGAGVPRGRARVHGDGDGRVPRRSPSGSACRSWSPASSRSTSSRASGAPCTSSRTAAHEVENAYPRAVAAEGNPVAIADARGRLRGRRPGLARHRDDPAERLAAVGEVPRVRRRAPLLGRRHPHPGVRRSAAAARCCRG